jgi:hypothetical protein
MNRERGRREVTPSDCQMTTLADGRDEGVGTSQYIGMIRTPNSRATNLRPMSMNPNQMHRVGGKVT